MAGIPKEHTKLYFDVLCRTQKLETVLSLICATYQAKKSGVADVKTEIAKRLENAYNLFRTNIRGTDAGSGTYSGTMKQFESQYTIGHELCIWSNSNLDLTQNALAVAKGEMSIKEYFDIFFLSYFQPIANKGIHVLFLILKYMISNNTLEIDKENIPSALGVEAENEDINALCNFLSDTSYIKYVDKKLIYVGKEKINSFINRCNTKYLGVDGLAKAKEELDTDEKYIEYIMSGKLYSEEKFDLNYSKFKKLLSWFINQININNDLADGKKTSGQGYKENSSIRDYYKEWRDYGSFTLDCNIISGYQSAFSKVNYINKTNTGINVRPKFDKDTKEIKYVYIDVYDITDDLSPEVSKILEKEYQVVQLGLMNDEEPNETLKELFDDYCIVINHLANKENPIDYDSCERLQVGTNVILYGVPGAGKSYAIENEYCDKITTMERVVFHPDYTYSDFVGQILPKSVNGDVTYEFMPGPFTKIVRDAYQNPMKKYILVIEEINRGNAPAIFGDIFQLLDRDGRKQVKDSSETLVDNINYCGSSYGIINADVARIIYGKESHQIRVPSNLSIICTMNTSDQNVFTLDTAFQRRWNMRLIDNTFKKETPEEKKFAEKLILDTHISWEDFNEIMNNHILEKNQNMTSSEDKRLGTHFVSMEDLTFYNEEEGSPVEQREAKLKNRRFPEKVLKYLWDDAFKFTRDQVFEEGYDSLEKVIKAFVNNKGDDRFVVFHKNVKPDIMAKLKTPTE